VDHCWFPTHLRAERARRTPLRAIRAWRSIRSNESRRGVLVDGWCPGGQRGRGLVGSGRHDRSQRAEGPPRRALRLRPKRDADRARRRMESVSPKIAAEVGALLKHRCPHAGARQEATEQHASGATAGDARRYRGGLHDPSECVTTCDPRVPLKSSSPHARIRCAICARRLSASNVVLARRSVLQPSARIGSSGSRAAGPCHCCGLAPTAAHAAYASVDAAASLGGCLYDG
jgi:hypothetical protein